MSRGVRARLLALLLLASYALAGAARAQASVELELGIGGNVVVGAWNPLRLVARDVPLGSRVEVTFDLGSLRAGAVPFHLSLPVSGGPGLSVVEHPVYVAPFQSLTWALVRDDRVVASGGIPGRDQDPRPLDVVLSRRSNDYASALGHEARVVDVSAAQLPLSPEAYDGVRSVIVDGTAAAPRLEALAVAAAAGALVVVDGSMPPSHAELDLLTVDGQRRLGAGAVVALGGAPADAAQAVRTFAASGPATGQLLSAAGSTPLVDPPAPLRQQLVVAVAVVFSAFAVVVTGVFGAPGLLSAMLLAGLLSAAAWLYARPTAPQVVGVRTVAVAGGDLALATRLEEHYTLPVSRLALTGSARPLTARSYRVDERGLTLDLGSWRSVVIVRVPELVDSPLVYEGDRLVNRGSAALHDVLVVGLGPQGPLPPGTGLVPTPGEDAVAHVAYAALLPLLSPGTVVALSSCDSGCTVWLAPELVDVAPWRSL